MWVFDWDIPFICGRMPTAIRTGRMSEQLFHFGRGSTSVFTSGAVVIGIRGLPTYHMYLSNTLTI